jgi:hypothetical protein
MAGQLSSTCKFKYTAAGEAQEFGSDIRINEAFEVNHRCIPSI